jgi:hypothetical protein
LTELVAIGHLRKCPKNKIGTHCVSPSFSNACSGSAIVRRQCGRGEPLQTRATPNCYFHLLDALCSPRDQKLRGPLHVMKWTPYRSVGAVCAWGTRAPVWPFAAIPRNAPKASTEPSLKV